MTKYVGSVGYCHSGLRMANAFLQLSKPAVLDSDSDSDDNSKSKDVDKLNKRLAAQKLEADRTGEVQRLQERQKRESTKQQQRRAARPARQSSGGGGGHPDLQDLDFGSISGKARGLPAPLDPDSDADSECVSDPSLPR
jgi:hypothetical protein